jgi:hypothetical protein
MSGNNWKAQNEYKFKTTPEEDKFIFEQAEKKLNELLTSSDLVVSRSTTLISLNVGLLVGLISFSVNRYGTINRLDSFISMSIVGVIYLFIVIWYISKNIKGVDHSTIGASPRILFSDTFFSADYKNELRTKMFIWSQIENYQDSIDINRPINEKKWCRFNLSMKLVIATPLVLLASFYIIRYLWS